MMLDNQWDALTEMIQLHTGALHVLGQSVVAAVGTSVYSAVAKRNQSDVFAFAKTYQFGESGLEELARIEQVVAPAVAKIVHSAVEKLEPSAVSAAAEKIELPLSANLEQLSSVLARTERAEDAALP